MGCCGEAAKPDDLQNRTSVPGAGYGVVNSQPNGHPPLEQPQTGFHQPDLAPPPATYGPPQMQQHNTGMSTGTPQWGQSMSPPPPIGAMQPQFTGYSTSNSPPPGSTYGNMADSIMRPPSAFSASHGATPSISGAPPLPMMPAGLAQKPADEGRMSISIDFGTTFSGVAYGSARIAGGQVQQILNWPGSFETFRKIPTCLLYDEMGQVIAWGLEAKNASPMVGTSKCEWFKLFLEPHALRDEASVDPRLPEIPPGKKPIDLIIDFLTCLWEYAKDQITRDIGAVADLNTAEVWLTVPAAWDAKGCEIMREAAIAAGLVASSRAGDTAWRDRLKIITEPEAAAVHCAHLTNLHHLKPSQNFIVCDAGGGTVDLAVYKIIGQMTHLEIAEMCARSGANCGSLFLDLRFRELVKTLLSDHPAHLDPASLAYFMHSFSETDKLNYAGVEDDDNMFHFTCFNVEDPHDPSVGLINGQLSIPGNLLRREVFDPVVNQVIQLLEEQLARVEQPVHALLLVGGFAGSEYLKQRVESQFGARIRMIARPPDADTATLRGAAQYGLAKRALVSTVISPRSYIMKVKLPAEQEDWLKRPAYIKNNDAGVSICENRLQYLVSKGAIIRKGQRLTTKFCKFSQSPSDSSFVATLFTSDSDKIMRYTDEGETLELCKWTVDLTSLPTFQQNAASSNMAGFYTEFELGLELDSVEVRGILLYHGQEWGRVTFDFLG
ncbi:hypothetical protein D9611_000946 [Ephemerocybe angulata]|uniref:Uncharacterized protein n=2 Tax=Ephemerocybe angulata TaxID=980116 RepID=A0A8H6HQG1_9AGAR|nr:hypothetical protein D9611_000946 [Tulosesus angulatus]KAF6750791.1 hypothetical protein DFP72DRAFT_909310 [Tulosesus angulatus]